VSGPAPEPLRAFIARSLRADPADVTAIREEVLRDTTEVELDRLHFSLAGDSRTLLVQRLPPHAALEVTLLPHLARKCDRVPTVHARGLPPRTTPAWPWLLVEDLVDLPGETDPEAILAAKVAVEQAVAADGPALAALRVPRIARPAALAGWPEVLVHGALARANTRRTDRGVVLIGWGGASLGAGLLDVVRLARDAGVALAPLAAAYARAWGRPLAPAELDAAEAAVG
jgi:hypothetical protein